MLYGAATFSEDIDLWVNPTTANVERFVTGLRSCGAQYYKLTPACELPVLLRGHGLHFLLPQTSGPAVYLDVMGSECACDFQSFTHQSIQQSSSYNTHHDDCACIKKLCTAHALVPGCGCRPRPNSACRCADCYRWHRCYEDRRHATRTTPKLSGEDLVALVPEVTNYAKLEVNNFSNLPSDYMDSVLWMALSREVNSALGRTEVAGVIISHGTDTLEETAYWLDLTVDSDKPVVLFGAQRNASESDFDGPRNLLNAVRIAVDAQSRGKGVTVAMNNQINAAREVTKTQTSNVETFRSGDFGFLGEVDFDRVVYWRGHCDVSTCLSNPTKCLTSKSFQCMPGPTST